MFKNIVIALLLCLFGSNITQAADDPKNIAGYGNTAWGMTPDQVLNAEAPRAERLEKPVKFKTGLGDYNNQRSSDRSCKIQCNFHL